MTPQSLRTRELRVAGIRTVLREAGPAHDREAAVFVRGNPGSSAGWAGLLDRAGGLCRAVGWDAPASGMPASHATSRTPSTGTRPSSATRWTRSASAEPSSSSTTWEASGACSGPPPAPARFARAVLINTGVLLGWRVRLSDAGAVSCRRSAPRGASRTSSRRRHLRPGRPRDRDRHRPGRCTAASHRR